MNTKPTLANQLYETLKTDIIEGRLKPAEKLKVHDIKTRHAVGTAPVREALCRLASTGLVESENQKGFRVCPMSLDELKDFYRVKKATDNLLLEDSLKNGDDAWEANMVAAFHQLSKLELNDQGTDPQIWEARNRAFHESVTAACHSKTLKKIDAQLIEQTQRYRWLWIKNFQLDRQALKNNHIEHKAILEAALARDIKKMQALHTQHFQKSLEIGVQTLLGLDGKK